MQHPLVLVSCRFPAVAKEFIVVPTIQRMLCHFTNIQEEYIPPTHAGISAIVNTFTRDWGLGGDTMAVVYLCVILPKANQRKSTV